MGDKKASMMKQHRHLLRLAVLLLLAGLVCSSCSSVNMHKHKRSHCDCPTF